MQNSAEKRWERPGSVILTGDNLLELSNVHHKEIIAAQPALDHVNGVHDGRMVAVEHAADVGQGHIRQIAE